MFRSEDGKITVDVVRTMGDAVFPAADFSIVNVPAKQEEAAQLFHNLYNTPAARHVMLALTRHPRKNKLNAHANAKLAEAGGMTFLDVVHLWYERPSTSSNIGLLPTAEEGYLLYKGDVPNVKNTAWFADGLANATNHWGLTPADYEERVATYHKKFSWEVALLLYTMCEPVEHKRMIYTLDDDYEHVLKFSKTYGVQVHFVVLHDTMAKNIISRYEVT